VMMIFLVKPSGEIIEGLLTQPGSDALSYPFAGATRERCEPPAGYDSDHNRICLGRGERVFTAACSALRNWRMFDLGWVEACDPNAPIQPGSVVPVLAHRFGLWWLNICRIVYVFDEPGAIRRFGFAYGTTEHHVERGEERFAIEWHKADDSVWYEICAFSQPAYWMVRLGYPLARRLQRKFARDSKNAMLRAVREAE
jgi:uncharacterized protein (UPF0548 family)